MNTFCSQNVQTMSELMDLAAVPYHILAPRDGKPMVEIVQDTMVGSFRLTKDWTRIHDKTMANLQMHNSYFKGALPAANKKDEYHYSGKQAYSQIFYWAFYHHLLHSFFYFDDAKPLEVYRRSRRERT